MKGIVLAGGSGSRLHPMTLAVSKQLLPIGDKPMVYYPLSVLLHANIRDILIITTPEDQPNFRRLLGDGSWLGINITYAEQAAPNGLAEAFIIGADHVGDDTAALVLGDNIFHGPGFAEVLEKYADDVKGCVLFGYPVRDPERYGVGETDGTGRLISIEEKPKHPRSHMAITGLYFYDNDVIDIAKSIKPSARGELEITEVNRVYLSRGMAHLVELGRGFAWLDTGTPESLLEAGHYVQTLEHRQGIRLSCLEEIAVRKGYIDIDAFRALGATMPKAGYGRYILEVADELVASGAVPVK